jgi:two-component system, NtrC family, sensor kinase
MNFDVTAVAHDLRAPLHVMLGHARLLAVETLTDAGRHRLEVIEAQIHWMATLIDGCLPQPARPRKFTLVDLNATIHDVLVELDGMLPRRRIEVSCGGEDRLPLIPGEASDLHRVLVNLFVNAADAMPDGGRIMLRARIDRMPARPVAAIVIDITDTGTGIPLELVPHVFDRGFTTKPPGQGTGLGLAICRDIVQAHGGRIDLTTAPGHGTTVRVSLPVGASAVDEAPA